MDETPALTMIALDLVVASVLLEGLDHAALRRIARAGRQAAVNAIAAELAAQAEAEVAALRADTLRSQVRTQADG